MSRAAHTGRLLLATALAALALASGACGGQQERGGQPEQGSEPQQPQAAEPANARFDLTIGDLVPRSGDLAPFAPAAIKSADLAVRRANAALKREDVKGVEVAVRHADTKTDGRAARTAARKLLGRGATCLTGAWASASTIPVAQAVASAQQVPLISPASTSSQITTLEDQGYVFRTAPSNNLQGEALADVVEEELGGSDDEIVVAGRNDAYGQGIAQTFRRAWEAKGGRLTSAPVLYDPKEPDLKEESERIVSGDPAAFVIVDFPDTYATISKELLDTGKFRTSRLFVTDGLAGEGLTDTVPERALRGARGTRPGTREEGGDAEAFDRLFTRSDERPRERQTFDAQNFDATMLCFLAAVAAGSNEGAAIQSKLRDVSGPPGRPVSFRDLDEAVRLLRRGEDIDYRGASGPIDFDAQGDPTVGTYEVFRYGRGGRFTIERQVEAKAGQGVVDEAGDLSQPQGDEASR